MSRPNPKEIANAIAEFPKDCQDKVTKLVEKLGFEVEKKLEPGQVWKTFSDCEDKFYFYLVYRHSDGRLRATTLDGTSWLGSRVDGDTYLPAYLKRNGIFVAKSLEEYYRKKFAGEL